MMDDMQVNCNAAEKDEHEQRWNQSLRSAADFIFPLFIISSYRYGVPIVPNFCYCFSEPYKCLKSPMPNIEPIAINDLEGSNIRVDCSMQNAC